MSPHNQYSHSSSTFPEPQQHSAFNSPASNNNTFISSTAESIESSTLHLSDEFKTYFSDALFSDVTIRIPVQQGGSNPAAPMNGHSSPAGATPTNGSNATPQLANSPHSQHYRNIDMKAHRFVLAYKSEFFKKKLLLSAVEEEQAEQLRVHQKNGSKENTESTPQLPHQKHIINFQLPVELIPSFLLFLDFAYTGKAILSIENVWNAYCVACVVECSSFMQFCEEFVIQFLNEAFARSWSPYDPHALLNPQQLQFIIHSIHKLHMKKVQEFIMLHMKNAENETSHQAQPNHHAAFTPSTAAAVPDHESNSSHSNQSMASSHHHPPPPPVQNQSPPPPPINQPIPSYSHRLRRRRSTIEIIQYEQKRISTSGASFAPDFDPKEDDPVHNFQNFQFPPPSNEEDLISSTSTESGEMERSSPPLLSDPSDEPFIFPAPSNTQQRKESIASGVSILKQCHSAASAEVTESRLHHFLSHAISTIASYLKAERATVFIFQSSDQTLQSFAAISERRISISCHEGLAGKCWQQGAPIFVNEVRNGKNENGFCPRIDSQTGFSTVSVLCVPLWTVISGAVGTHSGSSFSATEADSPQIRGVVQVLNHEKNSFTPTDVEMLATFSNFVSRSIDLLSESVKKSKELPCVLVSPNDHIQLQQRNGVSIRYPVRKREYPAKDSEPSQKQKDLPLTQNELPESSTTSTISGAHPSSVSSGELKVNTTRKRKRSSSGFTKGRKRSADPPLFSSFKAKTPPPDSEVSTHRTSMSAKMGRFKMNRDKNITFHNVKFDVKGNPLSGRKKSRKK